MRFVLTLLLALAVLAPASDSHASQYFRVEVVDTDTREPLPGVHLVLINKVVYVTDLNGVVAFHEPELMDREVFFAPLREGYEHAADGFGFRGKRLKTTPGASATLEMKKVGTPPPHGVTSTGHTELLKRQAPDANDHFYVRAIDEATGRGVPLVEIRFAGRLWVTDSAGRAAIFDPDLMKQKLKPEVRSHGYELSGAAPELEIFPNTSAELRLKRKNIAERLYRVTGSQIYGETVKLGFQVPLEEPLLNADVMGQDTVMAAVFKGRIHWFWGDTNRPSYPLGLFRVSGATSKLPESGGLDPSEGVNLEYFKGEDGFSRVMAPASEFPGDGAIWVSGLVTVGEGASQQLFAQWGRYPSLAAPVEAGFARWDEPEEIFKKALTFAPEQPVVPEGNAIVFANDEGDFVYHQNLVRIPAKPDAMVEPGRYQSWTPLKVGSADQVEHGEIGEPRYGWRHAPPLSKEQRLGRLVPPEYALAGHIRDLETGSPIEVHDNGHLGWSSRRERFFRLMTQVNGATSFLGELWYAEADTPMGPWVWARKILTHDRYTFYNPRHHPFFDQDYGRFLYFEGTYTDFLSGNKEPTPRYDYNQVMYRLDLDDPRLAMPVAIYEVDDGVKHYRTREQLPPGASVRPAFFALDRHAPGSIAIHDKGSWLFAGDAGPSDFAVFHAFPVDSSAPASTVPLYEFTDALDRCSYSTDPNHPGGTRSPNPIARVWPSPIKARFPATEFPTPLKADAGPDQVIAAHEIPADGRIEVQLDGSKSRAVRGAQYTWFRQEEDPIAPGTKISRAVATGPAPKIVITLPEDRRRFGGSFEFELVLEGPDGKAHDFVTVSVSPEPGFNDSMMPDDGICACRSASGSTAATAGLLALVALRLARRRRRT